MMPRSAIGTGSGLWVAAVTFCLASVALAAPSARFTPTTDNTSGRVVFLRNETGQPAKALAAKNLPRRESLPVFDPAELALPEWTNSLAVADRFLDDYAHLFGEPQPRQHLRRLSAERDHLGMTHVRYQQEVNGIPVFGTELIVHLNPDDTVSSAGGCLAENRWGEGLARVAAKAPQMTTEAASALGKAHWQQQMRTQLIPEVRRSALRILAPGLIHNTPDPSAHLVWEVKVAHECPDSAESYYFDVVMGTLREQLSDGRQLTRQVYDCSSQPGTDICNIDYYVSALNYTFGRSEGQPARGPNPRYLPGEVSTDVDDVYDMLADIMTYYWTTFGRNGGNNRGGIGDGALLNWSITRVFTYLDFYSGWPAICPNADFVTNRIRFCRGSVLFDVLGHEYAHVVSWNSHLNAGGFGEGVVYSGESGSLDENQTDIAGEMFELDQTASCDWQCRITTTLVERSLSDPPSVLSRPAYGFVVPHPDRYTSRIFYCGSGDNRGVHINSTVPSKAAYLLGEGGYFNGCTIAAIGKDKVEQIWYRATTRYYGKTETFNGAYAKLIQSAADLYGADSETVRQVRRALQSVELDQSSYCSGQPPRVPHALDVEGW